MRRKVWASILCVFFLALFTGAAFTAQAPESAFSDPDTVLDMPESWKNQPIQHDPSVGKADIVIHFNRQVYQALRPFIERFGKENDLKIVLTRSTCGITAGVLKNKRADIGMFCCPPGKTDRMPGLSFHTVGIMPLALLVHPKNSIDSITIEQARQIFQGEIHRWSELKDSKGRPGMNTPIRVIARRHCKKRPGHWKLLLEESDLFSPRLQEVGAIPDMIYLVASNPAAIGYEVMQMVREFKDKGEVKPLKIDEVASNLLSARYPLYRTYVLTLWENEEARNPLAERLLEYILTNTEHIDPQYGIIPASSLRKSGWKFKGNELIGQPD
jgi:ABC-type phosphate transport system substrate-binding protein